MKANQSLLHSALITFDQIDSRKLEVFTRRPEALALFTQALAIVVTSLVDKVAPDGQRILWVLAAVHAALACLAWARGGFLYRGGWPLWLWLGAALLMPLFMAWLLPIGEYGASPACVQLCGYPNQPLIVLAFLPSFVVGQARVSRSTSIAVAVMITLMPLGLMVAMYGELSQDNLLGWFSTLVMYVGVYFTGLIFGSLSSFSSELQVAVRHAANDEHLNRLHDKTMATLGNIERYANDHAGLEVQRQLRRLISSVRDEQKRLREGYPFVTMPEILEPYVAQLDNLYDEVTVSPVAGMTLNSSLGQFVDYAIGALISNVVRHAEATRVAICVRVVEQQVLSIEIDDDGRGLDDPSVIDDERKNLNKLRRRARAWGGDLRFQPSELGGTRMQLWIPLGHTSRSERTR